MFITSTTAVTENFNLGYEIVMLILTLFGTWFILEKMGEKGWKGLIPFVGDYIICKHVWNRKGFWAMVITGVIGAVGLGTSVALIKVLDPLYCIMLFGFALLLLLVNLVLNFKMCHRLSVAFGHGIGYTIGLVILQPLFFLILGLSKKEQYQVAC